MGDNYWGSSGGNYWGSSGDNYWGSSGSGDNYWGSSGGKSNTNSGGGSNGGTWAWEVSLTFIFWDEIRRYYDSAHPPTFDGGTILEVIPGAKYTFKNTAKTKLQGAGKTVMIEIGSNTNIKKGMYALVLCTGAVNGGTTAYYSIVSAKYVGSYPNDEPSEYPV
jgi:hypothetical protein